MFQGFQYRPRFCDTIYNLKFRVPPLGIPGTQQAPRDNPAAATTRAVLVGQQPAQHHAMDNVHNGAVFIVAACPVLAGAP